LFSYLLRFLRIVKGAPVLLMTATLPNARRQALESICSGRGDVQLISGPKSREDSPRYRMMKSGIEEAHSRTLSMLQSGGKVLWICNTVKRVMDMVDVSLSQGLPAQPYHSRYRYIDRLKRQRAVIDGFLPGKPPMLAITTQVAEMSLDLSADLLVSEYSPVPSLIQRLGRLNRFGDAPEELKEALFVEPEGTLPYDKQMVEVAAHWLDGLCDGSPRSQSDLAVSFMSLSETETETPTPVSFCDWFDKPWESRTVKRAIEESGYTVELVRCSDMGRGNPVEMAIPMPFPKGDEWRSWEREKRFLIVPDEEIIYDEFRGAKWKTH
jgi:CRISPR-associated endonuclease/helicase Cas3